MSSNLVQVFKLYLQVPVLAHFCCSILFQDTSFSVADGCSDVPELFLSSESHKPFESEPSQGHLKFLQVKSESSHDLLQSSQGRVTRTVESLRVIGFQAQVNVESNEI